MWAGCPHPASSVHAVTRGVRAPRLHQNSGHRPRYVAWRNPQAPWQFLNFFPLPQGHGSLRPTFGISRRIVIFGNCTSGWSLGGMGVDVPPEVAVVVICGAAGGASEGPTARAVRLNSESMFSKLSRFEV